MVAVVRCRSCARETFLPAGSPPGPCPECASDRAVVDVVADRRSGHERRGPTRLQRLWDYDPRSWFDRRRA
jgi:hypothetical protein